MTQMTRIIAAVLCLGFAQSLAAQSTPPASDATGLTMGEVAGQPDGIGSTYIAETHGDWDVKCVRTEDGNDPCQLYQVLSDGNSNPVARISIFGLPSGQDVAAGGVIVVPLETLLSPQVSLQVDDNAARHYGFSWCNRVGCIARVDFSTADVDALKRGQAATVTIVPAVAPDRRVVLNVSLDGFTAGYDAVNKINGY